MLTQSVRNTYRRFHGNTGGVIGEAAIYALRLARAYNAARDDNTLEFVWSRDQDADLSWASERELDDIDNGHTEVLKCVLVRKCDDHGARCLHAEYLASCGGICVNVDDGLYRDQIEAELALEADIT